MEKFDQKDKGKSIDKLEKCINDFCDNNVNKFLLSEAKSLLTLIKGELV